MILSNCPLLYQQTIWHQLSRVPLTNWIQEEIRLTLLNALDTMARSAVLLTTVKTRLGTYSTLMTTVNMLTSLGNLLTSAHSIMVEEGPHSLGNLIEDGGEDEAITTAMTVITDAISVLSSEENAIHVV